MALIRCIECGKEISDKAAYCIHCGCPMEYMKEKTQEVKPEILYRVYLNSCNDHTRAETIKAVSTLTHKSVIEAKDIVNSAPVCIVEGIKENQLNDILELFIHDQDCIEYKIMDENSPSELPATLRKKKEEVPNIIQCPTCGMSVSSAANSCPHCGHVFVKVKKGIGFWGVVGAIIVSVLILIFF